MLQMQSGTINDPGAKCRCNQLSHVNDYPVNYRFGRGRVCVPFSGTKRAWLIQTEPAFYLRLNSVLFVDEFCTF